MATTFEAAEIIDRPCADVWACLTDLNGASRWMPGIDWIEPPDSETLVAGARLRFRARGSEHSSEVTALDPGRLIALTSTQGGVSATYTYRLDPLGARTRVTLDAECHMRGLWRLISPLIGYAVRRADGGQIARLKTVLEG